MSEHISGSDHKAWSEANLEDFGDFADCVEYVNQSEYGDGQLEGEWYYAECDWGNPESAGLPDDQKRGVIYWGTFGNYNSPGASHCTYAEIYDDQDEYTKDLAEWEAKEEYLESEDEEDEEDEEESEDDEEMPDEPEYEDIITSDHITFAQRTVAGDRVLFRLDPDATTEDMWARLNQWMDDNQFYPSVWFISDHGNAHLMSEQSDSE